MLIAKSQKKDIQDYDFYRKRSLMNQIENVIRHKDLIEEQRDVLNEYYKYISLGIRIKSLNSILSVLKSVRWFADFIKKPFNEATKEDVINFVHYKKRKGNNDNYINQCLIYLKAFYKWYLGGGEFYPDFIKWIKPRIKTKEIEHSELLTWEDIEFLSEYCYSNRDKAILYLLRDTGGRIEETILRPKIKDLIPDDYGFKLRVNGKTGLRHIRLIKSVPMLKMWLNEHKYKGNSEAPLFYVVRATQKTKGEPIKYPTMETLFCRLRKSSGIQKPINPHSFRHASVTDRAMDGYQEKELRIIYGWGFNSPMPDRYANFGEVEVDRKILEKEGKLKVEKKEHSEINLRVCKSCGKDNRTDTIYCVFCANNIDAVREKEQADAMYNALAKIIQDPDKAKVFGDLLKSVK